MKTTLSIWLFPQLWCVSNPKNRAVEWLQHMDNYRNYYKKKFQLFRTMSVFSFLSFFLSYDVGLVRLEQAKRGRSWVFKVTASQHPSATLWGWTPDSEGEPCSSRSTLLHFLSLKLQVPKGMGINTDIGGLSSFLALPQATATRENCLCLFIYFISIYIYI